MKKTGLVVAAAILALGMAGTAQAAGEFTLPGMSGRSPESTGGGWRRPPTPAERLELGRDAVVPAGLCVDCTHLRLLRSVRSRFVRCLLAESDSDYRRYPVLPVLQCDGHEPVGLP